MRVTRLTSAIVLTTLGAAAPAAAQQWKSLELGAFGQYTSFGNVLELDNTLGAGGMAGLFLLPNLVAEGDISFMRTDGPLSGKITHRPVHARLAYHIPLTQPLRLAVGLGYTLGVYDGDPTPNQYEDAVGAVVGLKYYFKPSWAFNVEALFDKFPSPANQLRPIDDKGYWNNSIRAGVNWIYPPTEKCLLTIDPPSATITQGDSRTFTATARSERSGKVCPGAVTFASTDNAISPAGMYAARTPGTATVTASYNGRGQRATASAKVTVNRQLPPPAPTPLPVVPCISGIDITPDTATVLRGETVQLTVRARTCAGSDTTVAATYTGGNVDQGGRFTAGNDTGVVRITATANVGGRSLTDVANIRVVLMRSTVVNFDLNSSGVDGAARSRLDQLIAALRANPRVTVRVEGHADTIPPSGGQSATASRRYNERLSLARADSVTAFLLGQGLDRSRFEPRVRGFSFCSPAVPHRPPSDYQKDAQGRSLGERANRRVEIFELAMNEEEQVRWVCGGKAEPVTRATPTTP